MKLRVLVVTALTALAPCHAHAQEADERARAAARTLAEDGVMALQNDDVLTAVDKLERAYQLVKLPTVGLWSARALVKAGRLVSGAERFLEVSRYGGDPDAKQQQAMADALREYDQLSPRIPSVTTVLEGARPNEAQVTLDGDPVPAALLATPVPVDPRHHVLRATRGAESVERAFDLAEGQKITVTLPLRGSATPPVATPVPATAPPATAGPRDASPQSGTGFWNTQRTIGVAVAGAGVVSGAISGLFTAKALSKKTDSEAFCSGGDCRSQEGVDLLNEARSAGNVATITGIASVALIGAGVVVFVTAPSSAASAPSAASAGSSGITVSTAILPGGGFLGARGSF